MVPLNAFRYLLLENFLWLKYKFIDNLELFRNKTSMKIKIKYLNFSNSDLVLFELENWWIIKLLVFLIGWYNIDLYYLQTLLFFSRVFGSLLSKNFWWKKDKKIAFAKIWKFWENKRTERLESWKWLVTFHVKANF